MWPSRSPLARSAVRYRAARTAASCWRWWRSRSRRPRRLKQNWDRAKETLLEQKRQTLEGLYVQNLRDKLEKEGKIKINKKEMERLSRLERGLLGRCATEMRGQRRESLAYVF